ncbi:amino acid ABC transporter permease [Actinomadura sp. B10D3]|uniref:amino acid ABC transporter permease n=1 Tax=Actinomadura sp. B10D3 TaxID=3153557 RepID=UPI00325D44EF
MDHLTVLAEGIPGTLLITFGSLLIGVVGGVPLMLLRRSRLLLVRAPVQFVVDLLRAVPPVAWLFFIYYGLAQDVIKLEKFTAGILGLGMVSCAYMAEVYRGGLLAVDKGQWEAARALGISEARVFAEIIAPQAMRAVVAPATSFAIALLKDSSIVSIIGVVEITYLANTQTQLTFEGLTIFTIAAVLYVALSVPLALFSRRLDRRFRVGFAR